MTPPPKQNPFLKKKGVLLYSQIPRYLKQKPLPFHDIEATRLKPPEAEVRTRPKRRREQIRTWKEIRPNRVIPNASLMIGLSNNDTASQTKSIFKEERSVIVLANSKILEAKTIAL